MKVGKLILCLVVLASGIEARAKAPTVTGVFNGRWLAWTVSPGAIGYVFGTDFGAREDTIVTVDGQRAEALAVSSNRIRVLFPASLPVGHSTLAVAVDGAVSETVNISISAPAEERASLAKGSVSPGRTARSDPSLFSERFLTPQSAAISAPTDSTTGTGIVYTCDPTITAASATACDTLNTTIAALYSKAFTNANASIYVMLGNVGLGQSNYGYSYYDYSSYRNALIAAAAGPNDNIAIANSLPAVNPFGNDSVGIVAPLQRALGLSSTPCLVTAGCYDGKITISNTEPLYFRTGVISSDQFDFFRSWNMKPMKSWAPPLFVAEVQAVSYFLLITFGITATGRVVLLMARTILAPPVTLQTHVSPWTACTCFSNTTT